MCSKVEAYVERENLHLYCRNEASFHKLQLSHEIIYRNERCIAALTCISSHHLRRIGALVVHRLSRKDVVTRHSGWQYTSSCARKKELSEQRNCS